MKKLLSLTAILVAFSSCAVADDFDYQGNQRGGPSISEAFKAPRAYASRTPNPISYAEPAYSPPRSFGLSDCVDMANGRSFSYSVSVSRDDGFSVKCEMKEPSVAPRISNIR